MKKSTQREEAEWQKEWSEKTVWSFILHFWTSCHWVENGLSTEEWPQGKPPRHLWETDSRKQPSGLHDRQNKKPFSDWFTKWHERFGKGYFTPQEHCLLLLHPCVATGESSISNWCQSATEHNANAAASAENSVKLPGGIFYACCAGNGQMAEESRSDSVGNQENLHTGLRISDKEAQKVIFYLPSGI